MGKGTPLSEEEKIIILQHYAVYGKKWELIGRLMNRKESTVRSFVNSYKKHNTLFPKRGPKPTILEEDKEDVVSIVEGDPEIHLDLVSNYTDISETSIRKILHENKIYYHPKTPVCTQLNEHMQRRMLFTSKFINLQYYQMPNIIFTDESTVQMCLKRGGIWRRRGFIHQNPFM